MPTRLQRKDSDLRSWKPGVQRSLLLAQLLPLCKLRFGTRTSVEHANTDKLDNKGKCGDKQHNKGVCGDIDNKGEHNKHSEQNSNNKHNSSANNKLSSGTHNKLYSSTHDELSSSRERTEHRRSICTGAVTLLQRQLLLFWNVRVQRSMLQSRTVQLSHRRVHKPAATVSGQLWIVQRKLLRHNAVLLRRRQACGRRTATCDINDKLDNKLNSARSNNTSSSDSEPHTCSRQRISNTDS